jgi:hypothetical protein
LVASTGGTPQLAATAANFQWTAARRKRCPKAREQLFAPAVLVRPDGQRRLYSLRPQPFRELDAWLANYREL